MRWICKIRPSQLCTSVGRAVGLESRVSWVRVPPEAADFSLKSLPQVSLSGVVLLLCILEGVSKFVYACIYMYVYLVTFKLFCVPLCVCSGEELITSFAVERVARA